MSVYSMASKRKPHIGFSGCSRDAKQSRESTTTFESKTSWEIYNHKANEIDRELIKDWNESLNLLLIFTALYSSVLTAFIIESMKLLEEDPADTTLNVLLVMSNQLANRSLPAFERIEFKAPRYAIIVNGLFFTSLSCALIAALLAVLALQWVANYDMGLNTSSPRKRALQRHMRWMGVETWKMQELISSLPLIIFVALILFFVGIAHWIWQLNQAISGIVMAGIIAGFLLYMVTNVISIIHIAAPFRTSISKGFFGVIIRQGWAWIRVILVQLPITLWRNRSSWRSMGWRRLGRLWDSARGNSLVQEHNFTRREEIFIEGEKMTARDSLMWLANHLEISPSLQGRFLVLLKELTDLPAELLMDENMQNAPWAGIFTMMCAPYSTKRGPSDYTEEELRDAGVVCKALSMFSTDLDSPTFRNFYDSLKSHDNNPTSIYAFLATHRQTRAPWSRNDLIKAVEQACRLLPQIDSNYFHFILLNVQETWLSMSEYEKIGVLNQVAKACTVAPYAIHDESIIPTISLQSIKLVLGLLTGSYSMDNVDRDVDTEWYLAAMRQDKASYEMRDIYRPVDELHPSFQLQILAQLARVDLRSATAFEDFCIPLRFLLSTIGSKPLALRGDKRHSFITIMTGVYKWKEKEPELDEIAKALFTGLRYSYTYSGFMDVNPLMDLVVAMDDYLMRQVVCSEQEYSQAFYVLQQLLSLRCTPNFDLLDSSAQEALREVQDPCVAWFISQYCPEDWQFSALTNPELGSWDNKVEKEMFRMWGDGHTNDLINSQSRITFLRSIVSEGSSSARMQAVQLLRNNLRVLNDERQQVFPSPVLSHCRASNAYLLTSMLNDIAQYGHMDQMCRLIRDPEGFCGSV